MAYTGQQIVDRIREQLPDEYGREWSAADLLGLVNDCAKVMLNRRPDLRIGSLGTPLTDITLVTNFPFADQYLPAVIRYGVAMANAGDDEESVQAISRTAKEDFLKELYGGV
jgi:hypothetical protein